MREESYHEGGHIVLDITLELDEGAIVMEMVMPQIFDSVDKCHTY